MLNSIIIIIIIMTTGADLCNEIFKFVSKKMIIPTWFRKKVISKFVFRLQ